MPNGDQTLPQPLKKALLGSVATLCLPLWGGATVAPRTTQRATSDTVTRYGVASRPERICALGSRKRGKSPVNDKGHHPLVPVPPGSLTQSTGGPHGVLARMSSDVLAIVQAKDRVLAQARFRLGEYEFRGPDYRQILRWAEALNLSPEQVLATLEASRFKSKLEDELSVELGVVDGALSSLVWDLTKLPLDEFEWDDEVRVHTMAFLSDEPLRGAPRDLPPNLRTLVFEGLELDRLDLSGTPELIKLHCALTNLTGLDLSGVPQLTSIECHYNRLTDLDLSGVPHLTWLVCENNQLTELDLSGVPRLTLLSCDGNQLTELDLSAVPELTRINCSENQLTELDLSAAPKLTWIRCNSNQLTELDLSGVPQLTDLVCFRNQLSKLDLSAVPQLTRICCNANQLTELDLSAGPQLTTLECENNQLTELDLSAVPQLTRLRCSNNYLTELDLSAVPQLLDLQCVANCLTELDLSLVPQLLSLSCSRNDLSEIDIRPLRKLTRSLIWSGRLDVDRAVRIIGSPSDLCIVTRR